MPLLFFLKGFKTIPTDELNQGTKKRQMIGWKFSEGNRRVKKDVWETLFEELHKILEKDRR